MTSEIKDLQRKQTEYVISYIQKIIKTVRLKWRPRESADNFFHVTTQDPIQAVPMAHEKRLGLFTMNL